MNKTLAIVFLSFVLLMPMGVADEAPSGETFSEDTAPEEHSPEETTPQETSSGDPPEAEAPASESDSSPEPMGADEEEEEDPECSVIDNGAKTRDSLPVAPDIDGFGGFVGVFVGAQPAEDGGFQGRSVGVNTQCTITIVPDGLE